VVKADQLKVHQKINKENTNIMAKKTKNGTTNPSYGNSNIKNAAIDRLRNLVPGSSFNSENSNPRFKTSIAPQDTIHVTGYTNSGTPYKMFSKKGSPNEKMHKMMGGLPNSLRPTSYDNKEDDPSYVGNYNYKKPKK
jgi:hypothetical protein